MGASFSSSSQPQIPQNIRLYYFDISARAEAIRLCLYMAGIDFEDVRLQFDEWAVLKKNETELGTQQTGPMGQMPILRFTLDGKEHMFCQSRSILRYVGRLAATRKSSNKKGGDAVPTYPVHDAIASLIVDQALDSLEDTFPGSFRAIMAEKDEAKKQEMIQEVLNKKLPEALRRLDALIVSSNGGPSLTTTAENCETTTTWLPGGVLSIADLSTYAFVDLCLSGFIAWMKEPGAALLNGYPNVMGVHRRVLQDARTKAWNSKVAAAKNKTDEPAS
mmetsp:Transcript_6502/g.14765  ORF Transcript_6502/g.14765 Transcript_6502/m.14765 type:complete len:276 (-) Transcript_6502:651-1478(-)